MSTKRGQKWLGYRYTWNDYIDPELAQQRDIKLDVNRVRIDIPGHLGRHQQGAWTKKSLVSTVFFVDSVQNIRRIFSSNSGNKANILVKVSGQGIIALGKGLAVFHIKGDEITGYLLALFLVGRQQ